MALKALHKSSKQEGLIQITCPSPEQNQATETETIGTLLPFPTSAKDWLTLFPEDELRLLIKTHSKTRQLAMKN